MPPARKRRGSGKGNCDVKHFRNMSFKVGNSAANKSQQQQKRIRREKGNAGEDSDYEDVVVTRTNNIGVMENTFKLQTCKEYVEQKRQHEASMLVSKTKRARRKTLQREERVGLKRESLGSLVIPSTTTN
eukprot:3963591-Pleurochrysis_carterae.AAC.1